MKNERMTYRPFRHTYTDYDGHKCQHTFTCQKCGSHDAVKIMKPWGENSFWSGNFMCAKCGTSLCDGQQINYYSSCFHRQEITVPKQLELFA